MLEVKLVDFSLSYKQGKTIIPVFRDVNITLNAGEFHVFIGYSGCGKTSLVKAIMGLLAYEGKIYFNGEDSDYIPLEDRGLSYVPQNNILYPHLSVFDNIAYPLKLQKAGKEEIIERVNEIAEELKISYLLSRKPRQISVGQQQVVLLAKALIKHPKLVVLDEPLSNLDPIKRSENRILMREALKARGITVLYITHDIEEAMSLADRIHVVDKGNIVVSGSPKEVFESNNDVITELKKSLRKDKDVF